MAAGGRAPGGVRAGRRLSPRFPQTPLMGENATSSRPTAGSLPSGQDTNNKHTSKIQTGPLPTPASSTKASTNSTPVAGNQALGHPLEPRHPSRSGTCSAALGAGLLPWAHLSWGDGPSRVALKPQVYLAEPLSQALPALPRVLGHTHPMRHLAFYLCAFSAALRQGTVTVTTGSPCTEVRRCPQTGCCQGAGQVRPWQCSPHSMLADLGGPMPSACALGHCPGSSCLNPVIAFSAPGSKPISLLLTVRLFQNA